jgi:hypothetical protein
MPNAKPQLAKNDTPGTDPHHHKFLWNWRMLVLGILLNAATLSLVVYTVSLLQDYRECTQQYLDLVNSEVPAVETDESLLDENLNLNSNTNESLTEEEILLEEEATLTNETLENVNEAAL